MFAVIADVNQYHEFVPYVTRSREWDDRGSDKYKEAELEVGFSLITEKYTSKIELEPFSSVTTRTDDSRLFSHLTSRWRLSPGVSPTSCWVDFDVDFGFRSEIYGRLADVFLEDVVKKMMAAFEVWWLGLGSGLRIGLGLGLDLRRMHLDQRLCMVHVV